MSRQSAFLPSFSLVPQRLTPGLVVPWSGPAHRLRLCSSFMRRSLSVLRPRGAGKNPSDQTLGQPFSTQPLVKRSQNKPLMGVLHPKLGSQPDEDARRSVPACCGSKVMRNLQRQQAHWSAGPCESRVTSWSLYQALKGAGPYPTLLNRLQGWGSQGLRSVRGL